MDSFQLFSGQVWLASPRDLSWYTGKAPLSGPRVELQSVQLLQRVYSYMFHRILSEVLRHQTAKMFQACFGLAYENLKVMNVSSAVPGDPTILPLLNRIFFIAFLMRFSCIGNSCSRCSKSQAWRLPWCFREWNPCFAHAELGQGRAAE